MPKVSTRAPLNSRTRFTTDSSNTDDDSTAGATTPHHEYSKLTIDGRKYTPSYLYYKSANGQRDIHVRVARKRQSGAAGISINLMLCLGKEHELNRFQPSLAHLYVIRGIIGDRIQLISSDAAEFLQPYLTCLNSNVPYPGTALRATTSYEQVVERRGAELIIRIASNIQYMNDSLVNIKFGPSLRIPNERDIPTTNLQTRLIISKETITKQNLTFVHTNDIQQEQEQLSASFNFNSSTNLVQIHNEHPPSANPCET
ncbi:unnamed protein product [Rotaria sordida]|uniref:Uncharacterized protein n=2 Tax=Rotaria sordida TaxID=392033 RepID=A0A819DKL6_9BILA|nr:unnamed protein product [Rotaria sordida]CAF1478076.1 unnamed protein product [Rotaria sordida]CAF3792990.1 unnamed protein product [Rotaria sordida]CAF3830989.1 unnamed protein product [Rotaria sordida]